jgi:hypothetical protein
LCWWPEVVEVEAEPVSGTVLLLEHQVVAEEWSDGFALTLLALD